MVLRASISAHTKGTREACACIGAIRNNTFAVIVGDGSAFARLEGTANDNNWHHVAFTFKAADANGLRRANRRLGDVHTAGFVVPCGRQDTRPVVS